MQWAGALLKADTSLDTKRGVRNVSNDYNVS